MSRAELWLAAFALAASCAAAQDSYLDRRNQLARQQPEGVAFTISAPKAEFFQGEIITLRLEFSSTKPKSFLADSRLQDRIGRLNGTEVFLASPSNLCEDPIRGLPGSEGGLGGLSGGPAILSEKPFEVVRDLNDWVRFMRPGTYRLYVLSRRVSRVEDPQKSDYYVRLYEHGKPLELVSNVLTLRILPAPTSWVKHQIALAKTVLDAPVMPYDQNAQRERVRAMRVLRFLGTPEAAEELVRRLPEGQDIDSYSAYMGVLGSPYRKKLLPLMERLLTAADQPVSIRWLDTLAQLAELTASGAPLTPWPAGPAEQKTWQEESRRRAALQEQKRNEYAARLFAALPSKEAKARAVSVDALFSLGAGRRPRPVWFPDAVSLLAASFRDLPVLRQSTLLQYSWTELNTPAFLPVLRDLVANPPQQRMDPPVESTALRRLYELAPQEGRKIILDEIRQPTKRLPFSTLAILPDAELPEMDDALVSRFDPLLILRYGTKNIVKRVEEKDAARNSELARQHLPFCAGPLAFYFLKYDPPYGERLLRGDFEKQDAPPACFDIGFQFRQFGRWAYSPALERLAIESLTSPNVAVKSGAAEVLGKYASAAAEKPLWETLEYFHSWWKGREDGLKEQQAEGSVQFELRLRTALAKSDSWVLSEPEFRRMEALCSTDWCRGDVARWMADAKQPFAIKITLDGNGLTYAVAQYGPGDEAWLRRKLMQYPANATFRIETLPNGAADPRISQAQDRVIGLIRNSGRNLTP